MTTTSDARKRRAESTESTDRVAELEAEVERLRDICRCWRRENGIIAEQRDAARAEVSDLGSSLAVEKIWYRHACKARIRFKAERDEARAERARIVAGVRALAEGLAYRAGPGTIHGWLSWAEGARGQLLALLPDDEGGAS